MGGMWDFKPILIFYETINDFLFFVH